MLYFFHWFVVFFGWLTFRSWFYWWSGLLFRRLVLFSGWSVLLLRRLVLLFRRLVLLFRRLVLLFRWPVLLFRWLVLLFWWLVLFLGWLVLLFGRLLCRRAVRGRLILPLWYFRRLVFSLWWLVLLFRRGLLIFNSSLIFYLWFRLLSVLLSLFSILGFIFELFLILIGGPYFHLLKISRAVGQEIGGITYLFRARVPQGEPQQRC